MTRRLSWLCLAPLALSLGCEQHGLPPNPEAAPPATAKKAIDTRTTAPSLSGPMMPAETSEVAAPEAAAPADRGGSVTGTVSIPAELAATAPQGGTLFVIARNAQMQGGPPMAVLKLTPGAFPVEFSLSQANVMMQGMPFTGPFNITARLDQDGNAMSKTPGDLSGGTTAPVDVGATGVQIVLSEVQP